MSVFEPQRVSLTSKQIIYNDFILNALVCYYMLLNLAFIKLFFVNSHISIITTMENV